MAPLPIVYLPGAGGRSSFWRPVADRLWQTGAPIVLGYPGFGDAPEAPSLRTLPAFYDDASDFTDRLASVEVRTLLLAGTEDPLSPVAVGEFLRDRIPSATLSVV